MPGYTTDVVAPTIPWGTQVFNGLLGNPTESDFVDLATVYPDPNGPSRAVNPVPNGIMRVNSATLGPPNWSAVGNLALAFCCNNSATSTVTGISGTKTTPWQQVVAFADSTDGCWAGIYIATITVTGTETPTVSWSGGGVQQTLFQEYSAGLLDPIWTVVASGNLRTATGVTYQLPSLTSSSALLQMYVGNAYSQNSVSGSGTVGFTCSIYGGGFNGGTAEGLNLAPNTSFQPVVNISTSGFAQAVGAILSVVGQAALSGANYAGAASGLSGGVGTWVNPTNADGAPDSVYATWTAP